MAGKTSKRSSEGKEGGCNWLFWAPLVIWFHYDETIYRFINSLTNQRHFLNQNQQQNEQHPAPFSFKPQNILGIEMPISIRQSVVDINPLRSALFLWWSYFVLTAKNCNNAVICACANVTHTHTSHWLPLSFPSFARCLYSCLASKPQPFPPNIQPISCEDQQKCQTLAPDHATSPRTEEHAYTRAHAHIQCVGVCIWALTSVSGRLKINAPLATSLTLIMRTVMTL